MKRLIVLLAGIAIASTVWAQQGGVVKESLDAKTFKSKLTSTPEAVLLDVRTPEEVSKGAIDGAVNIDFNSPDFAQKISALDKTKTYFVYCAKGGRSSQAVDQMNLAGFNKLYNLNGGFIGWKEKGMPVVIK